MFWYSGNPHAQLDASYCARERAAIERERCVELHVDSLMIDCMDREDADTIVTDNDLRDSDLLVDLIVLAARAEGSSISATDAVANMIARIRAEFRKIGERKCDDGVC